MPDGKHKSGRFRKVVKKTPGSRIVTHFVTRKPQAPKCGACGVALKGVPRLEGYKFGHIGRSAKRSERPFGGVLCSKCSRRRIVLKARA